MPVCCMVLRSIAIKNQRSIKANGEILNLIPNEALYGPRQIISSCVRNQILLTEEASVDPT